MPAIEQGGIYWVTLIGSGSEQTGRRPCIVMSRLAINNAGKTVVVVPMTTATASANQYYRNFIAGLRSDQRPKLSIYNTSKCREM
jgi:mRNA-degrading endonuclease toxin of MazEF toxin-antitoxin module